MIAPSLIVMNKLHDLEPSFDFLGMDKIVMAMCVKDYEVYVDYLNSNQRKVIFVEDDEIVAENVKSIEHFIEWWFAQYKKRVKLTFTAEKLPSSNMPPNNVMAKFTPSEIEEIKQAIKFKLIEYGIICGTTVITESMFTKILGQYSDKGDWGIQGKLQLLNVMLRETRRLTCTKGTLIFIKPAKNFYAGLREYRDDGALPVEKQ